MAINEINSTFNECKQTKPSLMHTIRYADINHSNTFTFKNYAGLNLSNNLKLKPPPDMTLISLESIRLHDHCIWSIYARIEAIKNISVYYICSKCFNDYRNDLNRSLSLSSCSRCHQPLNLLIQWEANIQVDDNTSIGHIQCTGDVVKKIFKYLCNKNPLNCQNLVEFFILIENQVKMSSYESYDTFLTTRNALKSVNRRCSIQYHSNALNMYRYPYNTYDNGDSDPEGELILETTDDNKTSFRRSSNSSVDKIMTLLETLLSTPYNQNRFRFLVKLVHKQKKGYSGNMTRNISVQENRPELSYKVNTLSVPTKTLSPLNLECKECIHITDQSVEDLIYKQLTQISSVT